MKSKNENNKQQFNIPLGYFESFENRMLTELKFQELFPNKNDGFSVPAQYFEKVEQVILNQNKPKGKLVEYNFKTIAATVAAIAAVLLVLFNVVNPIEKEMQFDSLSITSLENYFEEEERVQDYLSAEELSTIENSTSIFDNETVSEELIYEYVDQDIVQSSLLDQ